MASGFNLTPSSKHKDKANKRKSAMEALARHFREVSNETSSNNRQSPSPVLPFMGTRNEVNNRNRNESQSSSSSSPIVPSTTLTKLNLQHLSIDTDIAETQIEKTLELPATISKYVDEKKYEEAHGLVKKLYKLGPAVNFISVLVNFYVSLIKTDRPEKAFKVKDEILAALRDNLEPDPIDIQNYGLRLHKKKRNFEAILFLQLAGSLHLSESNDSVDAINGISVCIMGLKQAAVGLFQAKIASKMLIKKHVLPEMYNLKNKTVELRHFDRKQVCFIEALWLHHIEVCEGLVGNMEGRVTVITEAIQKMREVFGDEACKFFLFGSLLHNLGTTFLLTNRLAEAKEAFADALSAIKKAEDYKTESERRINLLKAEAGLQNACDLLKSNQ